MENSDEILTIARRRSPAERVPEIRIDPKTYFSMQGSLNIADMLIALLQEVGASVKNSTSASNPPHKHA